MFCVCSGFYNKIFYAGYFINEIILLFIVLEAGKFKTVAPVDLVTDKAPFLSNGAFNDFSKYRKVDELP